MTMRVQKRHIKTYQNFLKEISFNSEETEISEIQKLIERIKPYASRFLGFAPVFFAIDYTKRQYLFWSDNYNQFGGHKPTVILKEGLDGTLDKLNPDYYKIFNEKVFPETLKQVSENSNNDLLVSFNHRMKNTSGKWMDVFQRCIYITDPRTRLPSHCIGMGMDISNHYPTRFINHTIERVDSVKNKIELLSKSTYNPLSHHVSLTKQERKILELLVIGLSSKMIADKLKISPHTVNNHRQNILLKTNCSNVAELIAFSINNGLILREF